MSILALQWAKELKAAGSRMGREGMSKRVIQLIGEFDGSYKGAMILAGRMKAIAAAAKGDGYWTEKVEHGFHKERAALLASPSPPELQGWRPIETAPKNLDVVLLFEPPNAIGQGHSTLDRMRDNPNAWQWVFQVTQYGCQPTHWMPLPSPPEPERTDARRAPPTSALRGPS